jgi:uncharacterized protein (DUF488 family)
MKQHNNHEDSAPTIFTIGHSNKSFDDFQDLLINANIQTLIDCRSKPRSRFSHFNQGRLEVGLAESSIDYEFRGENIGGLLNNIGFDETIAELTNRVCKGERIALMCSEHNPEACHRGTILAPLFIANGTQVRHLLYGIGQ